jgi:hypothetical protein
MSRSAAAGPRAAASLAAFAACHETSRDLRSGGGTLLLTRAGCAGGVRRANRARVGRVPWGGATGEGVVAAAARYAVGGTVLAEEVAASQWCMAAVAVCPRFSDSLRSAETICAPFLIVTRRLGARCPVAAIGGWQGSGGINNSGSAYTQ